MINKFINNISIFFIVFLVCSLTPANAVTLGEVQDNGNKMKDNLNPYKLNKNDLLSQLKLLKTQLSSLNVEAQEHTRVLKAENKKIKEKQKNLINYRNSEVKDGSNIYVNNAADHIVSELENKGIFANKVVTPLDQLKNDTIVQVVNEKGYIRYIVYDGLVQTEEGKTIVLIKNTPFQSKRYMTLEDFQKEYTGITIVTSGPHISTDIAQTIWKIQKKDLEEKLNPLKEDRDLAQSWVNCILIVGVIVAVILAVIAIVISLLSVNPIGVLAGLLLMKYGLLVASIIGAIVLAAGAFALLKYQEVKAIDAQIKPIEDEMIYLGMIGA